MDEPSLYHKFKHHVKVNKKAYIIGGTCFVLGGATAVFLGQKRQTAMAIQSGIMYKPAQTLDIHIEALGDPGNVIQDTTTGIVYASQNQAARELGLHASQISQHLHGRDINLEGHSFIKLGKAAVSE